MYHNFDIISAIFSTQQMTKRRRTTAVKRERVWKRKNKSHVLSYKCDVSSYPTILSHQCYVMTFINCAIKPSLRGYNTYKVLHRISMGIPHIFKYHLVCQFLCFLSSQVHLWKWHCIKELDPNQIPVASHFCFCKDLRLAPLWIGFIMWFWNPEVAASARAQANHMAPING